MTTKNIIGVDMIKAIIEHHKFSMNQDELLKTIIQLTDKIMMNK